MKKILSFIVMITLLLSQVMLSYAIEEPIVKSQEFTIKTTSETEIETQLNSLIEQTIKEENITYQLTDMSYEVSKSEPITTNKTIEREITYNNIYEKNIVPDESFTTKENGVEVVLPFKELVYENVLITNRVKDVTAYTVYENKTSRPDIPNQKTTTYTDKESGKTITVTLPLVNVTETESQWVSDVRIPITFQTNSLYYKINNKIIPYNEDKPALKGYEDDILEYLNLDKSKFRITDINWDGGFYDDNGVQCRKAIATGQRLVTAYRANYADEVAVPDANGYRAIAYYQSDIENPTGETEYTVTVTSTYEAVIEPEPEKEENNTTVIVCATVGVILIILLVVAILIILSKKKRS